MKTAKANRPLARTSVKDCVRLAKEIKNKKTVAAKRFLNELIDRKKNLDGKFYPTASKVVIRLIEEAENNATAEGLDVDKLFIREIITNKTFKFILPKSRWGHRGRQAKLCQINLTVEER